MMRQIIELAMDITIISASLMMACFAAVCVMIVAATCFEVISDIFDYCNKLNKGDKHNEH